jgi:hypothetical protein
MIREYKHFFVFFFFFCSEIWTHGLHLEPLHQSYFCDGFFWDRVSQTISLGWLQTVIFLISVSWVVRITCVSHRGPACLFFFFETGLNSGLRTCKAGALPFCSGYFEGGVSWAICLGWSWITIVTISAFQVARITGINHQSPVPKGFLKLLVSFGADPSCSESGLSLPWCFFFL